MWRSARRAAGLVWAAVAGLVFLTTAPAGAAPELRLEPASGRAGDTFTVIGTGFEAGDVELRWGGEEGALLGTATGPEFSTELTVPVDAVPNSHPVVAVVRDGSAVSTSNASFQVSPGAEPSNATDPEPEQWTATTVAEPATGDPPAGRGSFDPVDGNPTRSGASRGLGVTGGVGGDATEPVLGATAGQPVSGGGQGQEAGGAPAATADGGPSATGLPAAGEPSRSVVPSAEPGATGAAGAGPAGDERSGAALAPRAASQSSEAVRSPALLLVGLAMVFGGGVVLAVRNRHRVGETDELR